MHIKSKLCILLFLATTLPASIAIAQTAMPAARDHDRTCAAPAPADDPTHGITFDAVSIRPVEEMHNGHVTNPPDGDGITLENSTLNDLIRWDFNLGNGWREDQLQATPKWFTTDNYDVRAKVANSDVAAWQKLDDAARRLVFRKILVERFKLACHFVDEDRPVYNLVIAKGGLKMSESKPEDLKPLEGKGYLSPEIFGVKIYTLGGFRYGFPEIPMKVFADNFLTRQTGRTVIDRTGLTGVYTFTMTFVGEDVSAADPGDSGSASEPTAPSLFTALQEQLGLKLESSKGPVQVLVIDHAERPSAN